MLLVACDIPRGVIVIVDNHLSEISSGLLGYDEVAFSKDLRRPGKSPLTRSHHCCIKGFKRVDLSTW